MSTEHELALAKKGLQDINEAIGRAIADPAASFWLKKALRSAMGRDCVDAYRDAGRLLALLERRANSIEALALLATQMPALSETTATQSEGA